MKKKLLPWPRGKRGENRMTCTVPGLTNPCWSKGNTFPIAATHGSLNQWKRIGWEIGFPAWECHRWHRCTLVFLTIVLRLVVEKKLGKGTGSKGGPKRIEDICTPLSSHFLLFSFFSAFRSKYILNQVSFLDQFVSCFACRLKVAHLSKCGYFFHSWFHPFFFYFSSFPTGNMGSYFFLFLSHVHRTPEWSERGPNLRTLSANSVGTNLPAACRSIRNWHLSWYIQDENNI